ncbi:MAG: DNA polymerase III subunit gamma/tau [Gudongella sp.]|nr:DNA polymerase III subunit gamma/tau [Gudongella sp.]
MYQAIYRKFRPKTFDELLGQIHVSTILKNQVIKGNIGHAYLFSGTRGTGKTSAAKIFSRAVNCLHPIDGNPCNKCEICKGILDESIMDVIEMDAASNRKIEDIRELREKVIYPPSHAKYKVYIIDEVHMLTNEAFNALLKTLEEPPKHLVFILATTEPEKLPPTILSRCQRFDFKRLSARDMKTSMKNIAEEMGVEVEEQVFNLITANSDGAMRDALSLLDQCIAFDDKKVTYEDALKILGIANRDLIYKMFELIRDEKLDEVLQSIDHIIQEGKDISVFLKDLIHHYRNVMIAKTSRDFESLIDWGDDIICKTQADTVELHYIMRVLQVLTEADVNMKWSRQPRTILEMTAIRLVNIKHEKALEDRIAALESGTVTVKKSIANVTKEIEKKVIHEPEPKKAPPEPVADKAPVKEENLIKADAGAVKDTWQEFLQAVKTKKMSIYALVTEGEVTEVLGNRITLAYKDGYEFHKDAVSKPANKEFLENLLTEFYGNPMELMIVMMTGKETRKTEIPEREPTLSKDDAIKDAIDFFGEDIVKLK